MLFIIYTSDFNNANRIGDNIHNGMRKEKQTQIQRIAMLENIVGQLYQRQNEIIEQINKDKTIID